MSHELIIVGVQWALYGKLTNAVSLSRNTVPMPGLEPVPAAKPAAKPAVKAEPRAKPAAAETAGEVARLRALLAHTLAELQSLRGLLP